MNKNSKICAVAAVALCALGFFSGGARSTKNDMARNLSIFGEVYKELQTNYVDTINATATMRTAIDALLQQMDPYTEYYSADEQDRLTSVSSGRYAGIGSMIMKRDTSVVLSEPRWGAPAQRAGVRHGDVLLVIDGDTLDRNYTTEKASSKLKGQPGTVVNITVRRPFTPAGQDSIHTFSITRGNIEIEAVPYYGMVADGIGYINLNTFSDKTDPEFGKALATLNAGGKLRGLIIDLRDNGGGTMEGALQVVSNFVPKGTDIVTLRGRDTRAEKVYKTTRKPVAPTLPIAVLVNGNTASSSEILSGSLQDLDRAVIIGQRTYGKGLVQTPRMLPYGALMKITTGRYYLPSGRLIQAIDYAHRNADGEAERIPDSLTTVYHTRAGREVRDGGGITPEIKIDLPKGNRLLYNMVSDMWDYDFANKVANRTETRPDADSWEVSDTLFAEFKSFINPTRFKYDRAIDAGIKYMREASQTEGYDNDSVRALLQQLEGLMKHDLQHDLDFNKVEIVKLLDGELSQRWFSDADVIRRRLRNDDAVLEAVRVLSDTPKYNSLLAAPAKQAATKKGSKK